MPVKPPLNGVYRKPADQRFFVDRLWSFIFEKHKKLCILLVKRKQIRFVLCCKKNNFPSKIAKPVSVINYVGFLFALSAWGWCERFDRWLCLGSTLYIYIFIWNTLFVDWRSYLPRAVSRAAICKCINIIDKCVGKFKILFYGWK